MKEALTKFLIFFAICLYILGCIGGIGYCIHQGAWLIAVGVLVVAVMALPTLIAIARQLND